MPTSEVFLAPCANEASRNYLKKSVLGSVPKKVYGQYTDKEFGDSVAIWGVEEGELEASWEKINRGDYLLFYTGNSPIRSPTSKTYEYAARVRSTEENHGLSKELWRRYSGTAGLGSTSRGPWPYVIYLSEPVSIGVQNQDIQEYADYSVNFNPQRFMPYGGNEKIRQEFGSIENFIQKSTI